MASAWGAAFGISWGGSWGSVGDQGPSRAHKEEKKKSYRDTPINWLGDITSKVQTKELEVKTTKEKISILKKQRELLTPINYSFVDGELNELYRLLNSLLAELDELVQVKLSLSKASRKEVIEVFKEVDDFEDLLFILKFVLKRI